MAHSVTSMGSQCSPPLVVCLPYISYIYVHVTRMGEERGVHRVLVGKPEGKRPLGRPRHRWEDNIKMDLQEVGVELAQDRDRWRALVNTVMNFWVR